MRSCDLGTGPEALQDLGHVEADVGILIHAPQNVIDEFPQFRSVPDLEALKQAFVEASERPLSL